MNSTKKILCDLTVIMLAFMGLFLKKTPAQEAKLIAADKQFISSYCTSLRLHPITIKFLPAPKKK